MATTKKKPTPAQVRARKLFAERAKAGAFKRKVGARKSSLSPMRAATALDLTHRVGERGPRTYAARQRVATALDLGKRPLSSDVKWLESVSKKKNKRRAAKAPSPAQLAARKKFVAMVRARAKSKKKNSRRNAAGDSSVKSPTRTSSDVRSPTRTATSTEAQTSGNVTVTGGAGRGATTRVDIHTAAPRSTKAGVGKKAATKKRNPIRFTEAEARRYAPKIRGLSSLSSAPRLLSTARRKKAPSKKKFKKAGVFGGSGFLGLGRSTQRLSRNPHGEHLPGLPVKYQRMYEDILKSTGDKRIAAATTEAAFKRQNPKGWDIFKRAAYGRAQAPHVISGFLGGGHRAKRRALAKRFGTPIGKKGRQHKMFRDIGKKNPGFLGMLGGRKKQRRIPGHRASEIGSRGGGHKAKRRIYKIPRGKFGQQFSSELFGGFHQKKRRASSRLPNPSPASVFSEFRGKDVRSSSKSTGHGSGKLTVAQLGQLRELKLTGKKLEFGGKALLCADGRKRLHIGGVRFKVTRQEEDMGEVHSITYRSDKPHIETGTFDYVHKFGENGGKRPKLIVDAEGYPFLEGGSYKIDSDGIIN